LSLAIESLNTNKCYAKLRHNELVVPIRQPEVKLALSNAHEKLKIDVNNAKERVLGAMSVLISAKPFETNTIWSFVSDTTTSLQKQVTLNELKGRGMAIRLQTS